MKADIEQALFCCGRDRVFQRENGGKPSVAIRWERPVAPSPDRSLFLVRDGDTLDEAGAASAGAYAKRLRDVAAQYTSQAEAIERALAHALVRP